MITIDLDDNGTGRVDLPTTSVPIAAASLADARDQALRIIQQYAHEQNTAVTAAVTGQAPLTLTITPEGRVSEGTATPPQPAPTPASTPASTPRPHHDPELTIPPRPSTPPVDTAALNTIDDEPLTLGPAPTTQPTAPAPTGISFVREATPAPHEGVQSVIYKLTGGLWNLGPGQAEQYRDSLHVRATKPIQGTRNVTFMCLKGGISKTSTTLGVGLTLAEHRPDSVIALDANPDAGDLADRGLGHEKVESVSPRTITDLVHAIKADQIHNLTDLNRFTQTSARLHLLAGEQDPDVSESLTAEEYVAVRDVVDRFYPLTLTDCGTGVTHPAMKGILENAQQIVVASGWAVTGAKRAERTLTWLHQAHDGAYAELARNAVVVLTDTGTRSKGIDRDSIVETLGSLCRAVHLVPFDSAVAVGDLVRLSDLREQTRQAYLEVGATIVDAL